MNMDSHSRKIKRMIQAATQRGGQTRAFDAQAQADKLMAESTAAARTAKGHSVSRSTRSR